LKSKLRAIAFLHLRFPITLSMPKVSLRSACTPTSAVTVKDGRSTSEMDLVKEPSRISRVIPKEIGNPRLAETATCPSSIMTGVSVGVQPLLVLSSIDNKSILV